MDEEVLLLRAKEERDKIFERYDKGRESDNKIEPWEDPGFEVYHRTDKFVFELIIIRNTIWLPHATTSIEFFVVSFQIRIHSRRTIATDVASKQQCE